MPTRPQVIYIILTVINLGLILGSVVVWILLYYGGFFNPLIER